MKTFEIHDLTTNEILADNMEFDDIPELFAAYQALYPNHELVFAYRDEQINYNNKPKTKDDFTTEWFLLLDSILCNIY